MQGWGVQKWRVSGSGCSALTVSSTCTLTLVKATFPFKNSRIASILTPLLIPVSSSYELCTPTNISPIRAVLSPNGAPLWPQYVQQPCISAPISLLSCTSCPSASPLNVSSLTHSTSYPVSTPASSHSRSSLPGWPMQTSFVPTLGDRSAISRAGNCQCGGLKPESSPPGGRCVAVIFSNANQNSRYLDTDVLREPAADQQEQVASSPSPWNRRCSTPAQWPMP